MEHLLCDRWKEIPSRAEVTPQATMSRTTFSILHHVEKAGPDWEGMRDVSRKTERLVKKGTQE